MTILLYPINYICVRDTVSDEIYLSLPLKHESEFSMRWIHSVELEPWEEFFTVNTAKQIVLDRTRFKAFGAGVPESAGKRVDTTDGYITFLDINQVMPTLIYGISPTAQHIFSYDNVDFPLYETVKADRGVEITVEQHSLFYRYIH